MTRNKIAKIQSLILFGEDKDIFSEKNIVYLCETKDNEIFIANNKINAGANIFP